MSHAENGVPTKLRRTLFIYAITHTHTRRFCGSNICGRRKYTHVNVTQPIIHTRARAYNTWWSSTANRSLFREFNDNIIHIYVRDICVRMNWRQEVLPKTVDGNFSKESVGFWHLERMCLYVILYYNMNTITNSNNISYLPKNYSHFQWPWTYYYYYILYLSFTCAL